MKKVKRLQKMEAIKVPFEPFNISKWLYSRTTHLMGFNFDGTACFRKGAANGPDEIRLKSPNIETYSPYLDHDTNDIECVDLGNLQIKDKRSWQDATDYFLSFTRKIGLEMHKIKFLVMGGEHSISYAPIVTYLKQYPELILIHLDAHADLREEYEGHHFSHASIIRRVSEQFGVGHRLIQYGVRSGTKEEYQWKKNHQTLFSSKTSFLNAIKGINSSRPIYLTLDLDYFDPALLPGTGTPEPGGEDFQSFAQLMNILKGKHFVGADVVELAPFIDPTENSAIFAAKIVRELLLTLDLSR